MCSSPKLLFFLRFVDCSSPRGANAKANRLKQMSWPKFPRCRLEPPRFPEPGVTRAGGRSAAAAAALKAHPAGPGGSVPQWRTLNRLVNRAGKAAAAHPRSNPKLCFQERPRGAAPAARTQTRAVVFLYLVWKYQRSCLRVARFRLPKITFR